jgi:hypothetical protein
MEDKVDTGAQGQGVGVTTGQYGENGKPITDYAAKYDLNPGQVNKMTEKFKYGKDFVQPSTDYEREFVTDCIIEQLVEVKSGQWGKPVKLDQKALKFLIDESTKVF